LAGGSGGLGKDIVSVYVKISSCFSHISHDQSPKIEVNELNPLAISIVQHVTYLSTYGSSYGVPKENEKAGAP
jgi:hypothetical protein